MQAWERRTLIEPLTEVIVGRYEVEGGLGGGIVGSYGLDEGAQCGLDACEMGLQDGVHGGWQLVAGSWRAGGWRTRGLEDGER